MPEEFVNPKCVDCRYWEPEVSDTGACHRFPLAVAKLSCDWCGEWKEKGPRIAAADDTEKYAEFFASLSHLGRRVIRKLGVKNYSELVATNSEDALMLRNCGVSSVKNVAIVFRNVYGRELPGWARKW